MKPAFTFAEVTAAPEDRQLIFQLWREKARRSGSKDGYSLSALPKSLRENLWNGKPDSDDMWDTVVPDALEYVREAIGLRDEDLPILTEYIRDHETNYDAWLLKWHSRPVSSNPEHDRLLAKWHGRKS